MDLVARASPLNVKRSLDWLFVGSWLVMLAFCVAVLAAVALVVAHLA